MESLSDSIPVMQVKVEVQDPRTTLLLRCGRRHSIVAAGGCWSSCTALLAEEHNPKHYIRDIAEARGTIPHGVVSTAVPIDGDVGLTGSKQSARSLGRCCNKGRILMQCRKWRTVLCTVSDGYGGA